MNKKMESIEINIPTSTPAKPELKDSTSTKFGANKAWLHIQNVWDFCKEDTDREVFALKVGLAVLLVSLLILVEAPYQVFGPNIIWAIVTAIVVFEENAGATFSRGFNRALGTLVAGILAIGVAQTALSNDHVTEPVIIGVSIFMFGVITSYIKMWPPLLQYEYGFRVAQVTYCLIIVSDYRMGNPIRTMIERLYSIFIGGVISVLINVSIFPTWAGDQLHKELVRNFYSVADSLEECVKKYLEDATEKSKISSMTSIDAFPEEPAYKRCQSTLNSGSKLENLAKSAKWEPPHGKFINISYPWSQYVKVGAVLQHCAYEVMALHSIAHAEIQVPYQLRILLQSEIQEVSNNAAEVVRMLGRDISNMKWTLNNSHIKRLHISTKRLQRSMYFQHYFLLTSTFESYNLDNPSKSFANISHTFNHRGLAEELECYHNEIMRKQLRRQNSWPSIEVDAFEEDGEKNIKLVQEKSIKTVDSLESSAILSLANFTSSLAEFVARVDHLIEVVDKLSKMAKFKQENWP